MKKYAITINAVFNSIEELEKAIFDIIEHSKSQGLDYYPNCLSSNYDFDLIKMTNKNVIEYLNKRRVAYLLYKTDAFIECKENYKLILERLDEYVDENDSNRQQIESLLNDLI